MKKLYGEKIVREITDQKTYNQNLTQKLLVSPDLRQDKLGYNSDGLNMVMALQDIPYAFWRGSGMHIVANEVARQTSFNVDFGYLPFPNVMADAEQNGLKTLYSHENIASADILGVSISNPSLIMGLFNLLELSGLSVNREERKKRNETQQRQPLVVAGHMGVLNPAPFENYVDAFVIGDGDEAMPRIAERYEAWQSVTNGKDRKTLLHLVADIPGVYVPEFTERKYNDAGELVDVIYNGNSQGFVEQQVIGNLPDFRRASLIMKKGKEAFAFIDYSCKYKCGFCQMANIRGKYRSNAKEQVMRYLQEFDDMGVEKVVLAGASSTNYDPADLKEILEWAKANLKTAKPVIRSVRIDDIDKIEEFLDQEYLHIAPETGSDFLRNKILLKTIKNAEMMPNIERVIAEKAFTEVRMYCIVGIPTETIADRMEYVDLIHRTAATLKQHKGRGEIRIDMYPLMPHPGTPFEEFGMIGPHKLSAIAAEFNAAVRAKLPREISFKLNSFDPTPHILEGVLNTGDTSAGDFVFDAYKRGGDLNAILLAAVRKRINVGDYISKGNWQAKPWDMIRLVNHASLPKIKRHLARNIKLR